MKKDIENRGFTVWDFCDWAQNLFDWFGEKPVRTIVLYAVAIIVAFLIVEPNKEDCHNFGDISKAPFASSSYDTPE